MRKVQINKRVSEFVYLPAFLASSLNTRPRPRSTNFPFPSTIAILHFGDRANCPPMAQNTPASDEMSALEGMLNSLTLKIKAGGEAASEAEQQLRNELENMQKVMAEKRDRVQFLETVINGQQEAMANLVGERDEAQQRVVALEAENGSLRQHLDSIDEENVVMPRRHPVCVRCWLTRDECDLGPQCQSCISAGEQCVRKMCDRWEGPCQAPRCPRMHRGEFDEEQELWIWERGPMPQMDHRA